MIIDKFLYSNEEYVRAGACLAIGIVSSSLVTSRTHPKHIPEHVESSSSIAAQQLLVLVLHTLALVERMCLIL